MFQSHVVVENNTSGGQTVRYDYVDSAFAENKNLSAIKYTNYGTNGATITAVDTAKWDSDIKGSDSLWTNIANLMNSLGYVDTVNATANENGQVVNGGRWPTSNTNNAWWQSDIDKTALIDTTNNAAKWHDDKTKFSEAANVALAFNLVSANNTSKPVYFKHNGVIWVWTQTFENEKVTVTLSTDPSTVPNVYKGTKKVTGSATGNTPQPVDTAYTFKTWAATTSSSPNANTLAAANGVSFELEIAVK